jgi:ABC-type lipoprotein release transport system permease subunit
MAVFITIRPGVTPAAAQRSLDQVTAALNRPSDPDSPVSGVVAALRPAEIASYRTVDSTAVLLACLLATGAISALGLTLIASVRRRRREFALLKTLGFTQRQLAATVAWQSSVPASAGVIFGLPLGIAAGRWLWTLFARGISAVPDPNVPVLYIAAVAFGAVLFANLAAVFPGIIAARTPTALLLRNE